MNGQKTRTPHRALQAGHPLAVHVLYSKASTKFGARTLSTALLSTVLCLHINLARLPPS